MPSKREKLYQAAEALQALRCPVCGGDMRRAGDDFACANKHRVNVNRKGCVNFLSSPVDSCYDAALFQARRRVFGAGCYLPVAEDIEAMLPPGEHRLLDAGCGDGWYLNELLQRNENCQGAGVDISRDAILQATDQPCTALWCVGDLRKLPFREGAFTAILDVLTPANYDEFRRVLAPEGLLLKVYPGSGYLKEIRAARGMEPYAEGQVEAYLREKAHVVEERRVTVSHRVTPELWRDFVWMTPLNQDLADEEKEKLAKRPAETVTVDLHIAAVKL